MTDYLYPDRYFSAEPNQQAAARELYGQVKYLPLICPHGHVDPRLFADPEYRFDNPTELLLVPDHYIFRMLYSQGIPLEKLGVPAAQKDGASKAEEADYNPREAWQLFAEYFYLFQGTSTGIWLGDELANVFGVQEKLDGENAQVIYDHIDAKLKSPEFTPRQLFGEFNIEVLCTTDAATDILEDHQAILESSWGGQVRPTFRPDAIINLNTPDWCDNIRRLEAVTDKEIGDYLSYLEALENRRTYFKKMGATATDHAALSAQTLDLTHVEMDTIFQRALRCEHTESDTAAFTAGMLVEMARMSVEDGLVMQLHVGSLRNHNPEIHRLFGWDKGADIPVAAEFTRNLKPLLDLFGNNPQLTLILFNLDETTYARELAPLAGHYPALRLGPPWWFHDSMNGMHRYFDQIMETAGLYNTVGFNDDTRAFPSIPVRHDLWRRAACDWVAGLLVRHIIDRDSADQMTEAMAYSLAKQAYKL